MTATIQSSLMPHYILADIYFGNSPFFNSLLCHLFADW